MVASNQTKLLVNHNQRDRDLKSKKTLQTMMQKSSRIIMFNSSNNSNSNSNSSINRISNNNSMCNNRNISSSRCSNKIWCIWARQEMSISNNKLKKLLWGNRWWLSLLLLKWLSSKYNIKHQSSFKLNINSLKVIHLRLRLLLFLLLNNQ